MTPKVTIFTPTYNKPALFAQCAESVLAQTYQDWVWWVVFNCMEWPMEYCWFNQKGVLGDPRVVPIWFPVLEEFRNIHYAPADITNWLYPKIQTPYIYVLCDDDLIDKDGLGVLFEYAMHYSKDAIVNPVYDAVYGRVECQNQQPDGTFQTTGWIFEGEDVGLGTAHPRLDCLLDCSSVLHTKALWDKATANGWQMPTRIESAPHVDGILLDRLAEFATFHYVPQRINIHRRTNLSTWYKP